MEKDNSKGIDINKKIYICVMTWYRSLNYGTCLQCFALAKKLESMGYKVCVPGKMRYYSIKHPKDLICRVIRKLKHIIYSVNTIKKFKEMDKVYQNDYMIRKKKINKFINDELTIYKLPNKKSFKELDRNMNIFITGSDQIWNPNYISLPYLLNFVNDYTLKVAYGSSIGVQHIPLHNRAMYKKYLTRFDAIGVREKSAQNELTTILKKKIETVLDPTFLLNKEEWIDITRGVQIPENIISNQGFIFCYFIGENQEWTEIVKTIARERNLPVFVALSESYIIPNVGTPFGQAGIKEFIWMLANSTFNFTDSFHATALSINFQKEVVVFKRFKDNERNSQNSRIIDLLELFKIKDRLVTSQNPADKIINNPINYDRIKTILDNEKARSMKFITDSLNKIEEI